MNHPLLNVAALIVAGAVVFAVAALVRRRATKLADLDTAPWSATLSYVATAYGVLIGFSILLFFSSIKYYDGISRLVFAHALISLPFTFRILYNSLQGIPAALSEAAQSLGATPRQTFFDVTLPLVRSGIVSSYLFALALSLDEVAVSIFLVDPRSMTLPITLLANMRNQFDLTIAAASGVLILFTIVIIVVADRLVGLDRVIGQGVYGSKK